MGDIALFVSANAAAEIDQFDGRIGEDSSWFDSSRWVQNGAVPTSSDIVWIDESNTYACIDEPSNVAQVGELVVGRSAASNSFESVQLDLLANTKLEVTNEMYVGQYQDSDGLVYASEGSEINVGSTLFLGPVGTGVVVLTGNSKLMANDLEISGPASRVVVDDEATIVLNGLQLNKVNEFIQSGRIALLNKPNMKFDVQENGSMTTITVVESSSQDVEPTNAPTVTPNVDNNAPTPSPFVCKDKVGKIKFKNKKGKTKRWTCKKIKKKKKCSKNDLKGSPLWHSCPVLCNRCNQL